MFWDMFWDSDGDVEGNGGFICVVDDCDGKGANNSGSGLSNGE